jgi:hypothetical protein
MTNATRFSAQAVDGIRDKSTLTKNAMTAANAAARRGIDMKPFPKRNAVTLPL